MCLGIGPRASFAFILVVATVEECIHFMAADSPFEFVQKLFPHRTPYFRPWHRIQGDFVTLSLLVKSAHS